MSSEIQCKYIGLKLLVKISILTIRNKAHLSGIIACLCMMNIQKVENPSEYTNCSYAKN